jgi:hypothetical protein
MNDRGARAAFRKTFLRKRKNESCPYPSEKVTKQESHCNSTTGAVLHFIASLALYFVRLCRSNAPYKNFGPKFYWCCLSIYNCQRGRDGTIRHRFDAIDNNVETSNRQNILALFVVPFWQLVAPTLLFFLLTVAA